MNHVRFTGVSICCIAHSYETAIDCLTFCKDIRGWHINVCNIFYHEFWNFVALLSIIITFISENGELQVQDMRKIAYKEIIISHRNGFQGLGKHSKTSTESQA